MPVAFVQHGRPVVVLSHGLSSSVVAPPWPVAFDSHHSPVTLCRFRLSWLNSRHVEIRNAFRSGGGPTSGPFPGPALGDLPMLEVRRGNKSPFVPPFSVPYARASAASCSGVRARAGHPGSGAGAPGRPAGAARGAEPPFVLQSGGRRGMRRRRWLRNVPRRLQVGFSKFEPRGSRFEAFWPSGALLVATAAPSAQNWCVWTPGGVRGPTLSRF